MEPFRADQNLSLDFGSMNIDDNNDYEHVMRVFPSSFGRG